MGELEDAIKALREARNVEDSGAEAKIKLPKEGERILSAQSKTIEVQRKAIDALLKAMQGKDAIKSQLTELIGLVIQAGVACREAEGAVKSFYKSRDEKKDSMLAAQNTTIAQLTEEVALLKVRVKSLLGT